MEKNFGLFDQIKMGTELMAGYIFSVEKVLGDKISSTRKFKLLKEMTKSIKPVPGKLFAMFNYVENKVNEENEDDIRAPELDDKGGDPNEDSEAD